MSAASAERDARPEGQSSWLSTARDVRERLGTRPRLLELGFAGFVGWHLTTQAYRAYTAGALPESAFERTPALVATVFALLWVPFALTVLPRLLRARLATSKAARAQDRALLAVEPLALCVVLVFGSVHGMLMVWPLLSGVLDEADLRAELVADLSSTWRGFPVHGAVYLCAVGAAVFYAARLTLARLPSQRPGRSRAVISLAILACLLGGYAVIRNGSGSLLP